MVISPLIEVVCIVTLLITPLLTTHEPPSTRFHSIFVVYTDTLGMPSPNPWLSVPFGGSESFLTAGFVRVWGFRCLGFRAIIGFRV